MPITGVEVMNNKVISHQREKGQILIAFVVLVPVFMANGLSIFF